MLEEQKIKELLENEIHSCIKVGKAHAIIGKEEYLNEYCGWYVVVALCEILEINSCEIWNRIVSICPNMGEITDCT